MYWNLKKKLLAAILAKPQHIQGDKTSIKIRGVQMLARGPHPARLSLESGLPKIGTNRRGTPWVAVHQRATFKNSNHRLAIHVHSQFYSNHFTHRLGGEYPNCSPRSFKPS